MGREHQLQGNARVREESDRRQARVRVAVTGGINIVRVVVARGAAVAGLDVGERFLDLAVIDADRRAVRYSRIALEDLDRNDPIAALGAALAAEIPGYRDGAIV